MFVFIKGPVTEQHNENIILCLVTKKLILPIQHTSPGRIVTEINQAVNLSSFHEPNIFGASCKINVDPESKGVTTTKQ